MRSSGILARLFAILTVLAVVFAFYVFLARPYQLQWGATNQEVNRPMPGDELRPNPDFLATRAITIEDNPEKIWPWLLQMGYGRAGFYGYDILENLGSERGVRSAEEILPEYQELRPGDEVPISPVVSLFFVEIEPNKYVIWSDMKEEYPSAFTWALYPNGPNQTRLISRIGWQYHWTDPGSLLLDIFTEFTDHLAVREILHGVKGRVEGEFQPLTRQTIEFGIYLLTLLIFIISLFTLLLRPLTWRIFGVSLVAGGGWLFNWYAPISVWSGMIISALVILGLFRANRSSVHEA